MLRKARAQILKNQKKITRILTVTTILVCIAVVIFTVYMIFATDEVTDYVVMEYGASEQAQNAATSLEIDLLRLRAALEDYVSEWGTRDEIDIDANLAEMRRVASAVSWVSEPHRAEAEAAIEEIGEGSREVVAAVLAGNRTLAQERLQEVVPAYIALDRSLDVLLNDEEQARMRFVEKTKSLNAEINQTSALFAVVLVILAVSLSVYAAHAVGRTNADVYKRDTLFDLISNNVDEVFQVYDVINGEMSYVSGNVERVFGVSPEAYRADNNCMRSYIHAEDRAALDAMYYTRTPGTVHEPLHCEFRYTHPITGTERICHSALYPIRDEKGRFAQHVLLTRDVTEESHIRQDLETALERAEAANEAKVEFLSRMSHEIRTPINGIIGMEALATQAIGNPERVRHFLEQVNVSARHLLSLVNDILDMSKIESGRLELSENPLNLEAMLADLKIMVSSRTERKRQTLIFRTEGCAQLHLKGDELRLRQVLLNLLSNASKYTGEGGTICLEAAEKVRPDGRVDLTFQVTDNGQGISSEELGRIFLPFERGSNSARHNGTGLGLSISSHIVEEMGGRLQADSCVGEGSRFYFTVPLEIDEEAAGQNPAHEQQRGRILVVEDNLINMEIACEILRTVGYEVLEAADGLEGVQIFEKEPPGSIDAVLMDLQMPVMDGFTAAARMREQADRLGKAPILAMTANVFSDEELKQQLFDGYIPKPIEPGRMSTIIEKARQKRQEQSHDGRDKTGTE